MKKNKFYIDTYGCQMNIYDSNIIISILISKNYVQTNNINKSDIILINTCVVREKVEKKICNRINSFISIKKKNKNLIIIILGCLSKYLKKKLLLKYNHIDAVISPGSYISIHKIIRNIYNNKEKYLKINDKYKMYNNIIPNNYGINNKISNFITISQGCNNFCSFCVIPFTRGMEICKNINNILYEFKKLVYNGCKEIILLGQNVNSYKSNCEFDGKNIEINFSYLLNLLANKFKNTRIGFISSNPQDITNELLYVISKHNNIYKHIHLPLQSGSDKILKLMNRKYNKNIYLNIVDNIKKIIPNCSITYDIIVGFCNETEEDHIETLNVMKKVKYSYGYSYIYSPRPKTIAYKKLKDNVPMKIKKKRLNDIISLQKKISYEYLNSKLNSIYNILIFGNSKKNKNFLYGKNINNDIVIFKNSKIQIGNHINVNIKKNTNTVLFGDIIK